MASLILEIRTRGLHRYVEIDAAVTTIGRALDNDIILSDPTVAPHQGKILLQDDGVIELVNLAAVNPTRVDHRIIESHAVQALPLDMEMGRVRARLLRRDHPVADTRVLAINGSRSNLFSNVFWIMLLACFCVVLGGLEFYLNAYNSFKWSELVKAVLRDTILTIGAFVLTLAVLERLLVHRWEIKPLLTTVCLMYLAFTGAVALADSLDYLVSASWPSTLLFFGWYLLAIPAAIALYLIHISHLHAVRSVLLALLIASPMTLPAILQSPQLLMLFDSFSHAADYHQLLSYLDWRLQGNVDINTFIEQAGQLQPGEPAD